MTSESRRIPSEVRTQTTAECTSAFVDVGLPILQVLPGVFNPVTSFSGKFLAIAISDHRERFVGKKILDVGCGCGVLGLACMVAGASRLVATDISLNASRNAALNAESLGYAIEAVSGDLFEAIKLQQFDFIVFNPPGFEGVPKSEVEAHYHCPVEVLERFYRLAPAYLSTDGRILTATSDIHDPSRSPMRFAKEFAYDVELLCNRKTELGNQYAYLMRPSNRVH
jgi:SAM-dependent methyltransferase